MNVKAKLVVAFCLLTYQLFGQSVSGVVNNEYGGVLPFANILIKESKDTNNILNFTKTDIDGAYRVDLSSIEASKNLNSIFIEVKMIGHITVIKEITKDQLNQEITLNFKLLEDTAEKLDQVTIIGEIPKFKVKQDTISFKVQKYTDGTERKIEDIIKKLPGIDVNSNTGEIIYKGKPIETVTLDGDNLFGFNYTLGTKNINVDMVEQIEAIDNYSKNPLLKGIEQGGKVSLNLKLKKNKTNYSGTINSSLGVFNDEKLASNIKGNFLSASTKFKSFATLAQNNIGINHSSFDYFGLNISAEQKKDRNFYANKVISETSFSNVLAASRANINDQFFGNYNAIFKINPKLSLKTNLYYLKDKITTNQFFENQYIINNESFTTSDNTFVTKKPQQYRGDIEVKYNTSKTSLLEYNIRVRKENIDTPTTIVQNESDIFASLLESDDFYIKQDVLWTKKLSARKAMQLSLFHSINDVSQKFTISPSVFRITSGLDTQKSKFRRTYFEGKAIYLGSGTRDKYTFTIGININNSPFESSLFNDEATFSNNNFDYTESNIFNTGVYNINRGNWQISPSYSVRILDQKLEQNIENQTTSSNQFIVEPALQIQYRLNSNSFLRSNIGFNQNSNAAQYFFLNQILTDTRRTIQNIPSLELQDIKKYGLVYFNNDLYNQFEMEAKLNYQKSTGNFFTNSNITENTTNIEYFFSPQDNSTWGVDLQVSKYIPVIESTLKVITNYSVSNYRNIINNSEFRQNESEFLSTTFFYKTAFDIPINFENSIIWQYSNTKSASQQLSFNNKSLQNNTNIIITPSSNWVLSLSGDYYVPDTKKANEQFFFIDATLSHTPKNKKWQASFLIRNLANENNFEQIQTSDISTVIFRSNLLPRHFMVRLTWNF